MLMVPGACTIIAWPVVWLFSSLVSAQTIQTAGARRACDALERAQLDTWFGYVENIGRF